MPDAELRIEVEGRLEREFAVAVVARNRAAEAGDEEGGTRPGLERAVIDGGEGQAARHAARVDAEVVEGEAPAAHAGRQVSACGKNDVTGQADVPRPENRACPVEPPEDDRLDLDAAYLEAESAGVERVRSGQLVAGQVDA